MIFVAHRINTIEELLEVPKDMGVEIDVRDFHEDLILSHDPFQDGEKLTNFIKHFDHQLLVVNVKSYGIEKSITKILIDNDVENYFFLDSVMSSIVSLSDFCSKRFCGRISEFESKETLAKQCDLVSWVWVDCFSQFSLSNDILEFMQKQHKLKVCLTSPDLLGRPEDIKVHAMHLCDNRELPDAICTKLNNVPFWKECIRLKEI